MDFNRRWTGWTQMTAGFLPTGDHSTVVQCIPNLHPIHPIHPGPDLLHPGASCSSVVDSLPWNLGQGCDALPGGEVNGDFLTANGREWTRMGFVNLGPGWMGWIGWGRDVMRLADRFRIIPSIPAFPSWIRVHSRLKIFIPSILSILVRKSSVRALL